ncbi:MULTISPECIES: putative toxin-antitoxin system toxin component, PIN family [unclassified Methanoregula]|uniref:putative toxin-antitoxin system toxin component, PIN family n=1 Tax=unclassified Methanoregula TaxID=2649730 RepID=UPI0009C70900|nr:MULTISPECIES: putative toxin-antitoxin system toxin component, PIN family [unclassified Methanoregula]OPX64073.1 MAG: hypothetical protein A4E33_01096 [Methanoregula sp. PtaB.Bin085]OPY33729.1 MAG: hypothetical protein A4E34_01667 [Methanoregula sp. PtaU1.Bin006]
MRGGNTGTSQIVLDTNVLVSGLLSPHGPPAAILNLVINGSVVTVLDIRIFEEYSDVLGRKKFGFPADAVQDLLAFIRREGLFVMPRPLSCPVPDPDDLPFIEVSLHTGTPIITGNVRHFQKSGAVVTTPAEYLKQYWSSSGS